MASDRTGTLPIEPHALADALAAIVGAAHVFQTTQDMAAYLEDWKGLYHGRAIAAVRPGSVEEVSRIMALCHEHSIPVVPQGGNTGLCGGATPDSNGKAIVLLLSRLSKVRSINPVDAAICVEAGCVLQAIQGFAGQAGFLFPLSLGAEGSCQIGGNIATNAGGTAVLRYGAMRDLVLGLEVVLPDGQVCDWLSPLRKDNTGYDLKQLFIGSEGTLGIITAATLKLFPPPLQSVTAVASLDRTSQAGELLLRLRSALGNRVTSFELLNHAQVDVAIRHMTLPPLPFSEPAKAYVLIEVDDTLADYPLRDSLEAILMDAIEAGDVSDVLVAQSIAQSETIWALRHSVSEANKRAGFNVSHDISVPLDRQAELIERVETTIAARYPDADLLIVGHFGDGNVHVIVLFEGMASDHADTKAIKLAVNDLVDEIVLDLGGSISAEHGIGQSNKGRLLASRGPAEINLMRTVKAAIDGQGICNPGKLFDPIQ